MKKRINSTKKKRFYHIMVESVPESLKKLVGKEIIRIGPTITGDWSYTNEPVLFKGISSDNGMIIQYIKEYSILEERMTELSACFSDDKWILLEDAFKAENNELNKLIGKKIKRIRPVELHSRSKINSLNEYKEDHSYMYEYGEIPATLISASKYHMIIKDYNISKKGNIIILVPRYSNPKYWEEVKD